MRPLTNALVLLMAAQAWAGQPHAADWWLHDGPPVSRLVRVVEPRSGQQFYPVNVNNWWALVNPAGRLTVVPHFEWTDYTWQNRARAVIDGRTVFVDGGGELVINERFPLADRFYNDHAIVGDGRRMTFINLSGDPITRRTFDAALRFEDGYAAVGEAGRYGFIDRRGEVVIPLQFAQVSSFREGIAMVQLVDDGGLPGRFGFIAKGGSLIWEDTGGTIQQAAPLSDGYIRVRVGGRWGYLDRGFQPRIPPRFAGARDFHDGLAAATEDGLRWGFLDKSGRWLIAPRFEAADDFQEGVAMVQSGGRIGYITKAGDWLIEPVFDAGEPFMFNYARVAVAGSFGYVDKVGQLVWDPRAADEGFVDLTIGSVARAHLPRDKPRGLRLFDAPPPRQPAPIPYEPEYLYYPVLPMPEQR